METRHAQGVVLSASAVAGVVEAVGYEVEVSRVFGPGDGAGNDVDGEIGREPRLRLAAREEAEAPGADALERSRDLHRFDRRGPVLRLVAPGTGEAEEAGAAAAARAEVASANRIAARVAAAIGPERYARYFAGQVRIGVEGAVVRLSAQGKAAAGLVERRFGVAVREAAQAELGVEAVSLEVVADVVEVGDVETPLKVAAGHGAKKERGGAKERAAGATATVERTGRVQRLDDFIVGDSNRLAYNAALQLCEHAGEGEALALLFLHGACGVGKTHLLQGIANRYRETHPGAVVRVTTGEQFMNEFVLAIKGGSFAPGNKPAGRDATSGQMNLFRRQYRRCDLLCIDDVHFLASKQATQQELLHTFDEIARSGARVVLACDQHPRQIPSFSPALVSRFMSGMVATIDTPDAELREKAIRMLATRRGLVMENAAVKLLVERTRGVPGAASVTMRELEGLVTRVDAMHRLGGLGGEAGVVTAGVAERALGMGSGGAGSDSRGMLTAGGRPMRVEKIIMQTCTALGVEMSDLSGPTRHKRVVLARAVITHLAKSLTTMSYPEIARAIGRPSHSTVITAHQRLQKQLEADEVFGIGPTGEAMTVGGLVRQLASSLSRA